MRRRRQADVRVVARATEPRPGHRVARWLLPMAAAVPVGFAIGIATAGSGSTREPEPQHAVAGVPTGFAHSRLGAVAALLNYGAALGNPQTLLDSARRAQVLSVVATQRYAESFR